MINLSKGSNVNLTKEVGDLKAVRVSCGWSAICLGGVDPDMDLDVSIFLCGANGRVSADNDMVFYNNLSGAGGAVVHEGDLRTGGTEVTLLDLPRIPPHITEAVFVVTIHEAESRRQNFGMTESAFISIANAETNVVIARYDIAEESPNSTSMIFGKVYRYGDDWKFKAVGAGSADGLRQIATKYGVNVG